MKICLETDTPADRRILASLTKKFRKHGIKYGGLSVHNRVISVNLSLTKSEVIALSGFLNGWCWLTVVNGKLVMRPIPKKQRPIKAEQL